MDIHWLLNIYEPLFWPDMVFYFAVSPETSGKRIAADRDPTFYEAGQDITDLWDADYISIENFTQSLHRDVRSVRTSRGTPRHVNVFGYLYDIETGQLLLVEEKPGDPTAPRGAPWR